MFYVYIIKLKRDKSLYFGSTNDLRRRLVEHTKSKGDLDLIYYEAYRSEADARRREHNLKYFGKAYGRLKGRIEESLKDFPNV